MKKCLQLSLVMLILLAFGLISNAQSLLFDGVDDFVDMGNDASLNTFPENKITLEAWIYATEWKDEFWQGCVITKDQMNKVEINGEDTTEINIDDGYMIRVGKNGTVNFNIGGEGEDVKWVEIQTDEAAINLNTWHHLACVYDGANMIIYIDGIETVKEEKELTIGFAPDYPLIIGDSPQWPGRNFGGSVDEVRIWNVARSPAEIFQGMITEIAKEDGSGLIAYYKLNEETGVSVKDQTGVNTGVLGGHADSVDFQPTWISDGATITSAPDWTTTSNKLVSLSKMSSCYPNPATGTSYLDYELSKAGVVEISLYDIMGKKVKEFDNVYRSAGAFTSTLTLNGVSTGIYFVNVSIDGKVANSSKLYIR